MRLRTLGFVLLVALLLVGMPSREVRGDDQPAGKQPPARMPAPKQVTPEQAAEAVLAAVKERNDAALTALAAKNEPDPWLVADLLCYRGAHDAAEAFAKAAPRKATEKLPGYVSSRRGMEPDEKARKALSVTNEATGRREWQEVLGLAEGVSSQLDSVVRVQVAYARGVALGHVRQRGESARVLVEVGEAAARMGWLSQAQTAFHQGGLSAYDDSDWAGAISAWSHRLTACREIGDQPIMIDTLNNIGVVQQSLGNYPAALLSFDESLAITRRVGDKRGIARMLYSVGIVQGDLGNYREALLSHDESLAISREIGDKQGIAKSLQSIGLVQNDLGNYPEALEHYEASLAIRREMGDKWGISQALNNRGAVQESLGNHPEALRSYDESLAISREIGDHRCIARTLGNIGIVQQSLGNYLEALRAYDESLAVARRVGHKRGIAQALSANGVVQSRLGNYPEALRFYDESLAIAREIGDEQSIARTLNNIGNVQQHLRNYAEALRSFDESLVITRNTGHQRSIAATLINIGLVQSGLGKYPEALRSYAEAITIDREIGNQQGIATAHLNIGFVQESLGNDPEALEAYEQAQRLLEEVPNPETQAHVSWKLAAYHLRQDQPAKAIGIAAQGVRMVMDLFEGLAEGEGAGARDLFSMLFDVGTRAALRAGQVTDLLWFLEQGRAGSLREGLGSRAALEGAVLPEGLREALGLARSRERRALAAYREAEGRRKRKEIRKAHRAWEESRAEIERVTARIQREAKAAAAVTLAATDDLNVIQSRLQSDEVLLLFALTSEEAGALVVGKDEAHRVALPASQEIETAVDALLGDDKLHIVPDMVEVLSQLLVEPLEIDEDVTRVLVSPVGRLGYVPFALLFPDKEVAYVPSGTTHGLLLEERSKRGESILALGDPDYQTVADATVAVHRGSALPKLARLPATRGEVEAVGTTTLLGAKASESGLQAMLANQERWRAVHFACHGLVDPERPMLSALALTANAEGDGFLTALEIFGMKIPADLVVLSACETGKGRIYKTEGIVGLTRAFMFAGAPRVICSLWKVDDESTRALMIKFYELWDPEGTLSERSESNGPRTAGRTAQRGMGAAAALKQAQEYIRSHEKWKHPYYWAAWVLWGLPD